MTNQQILKTLKSIESLLEQNKQEQKQNIEQKYQELEKQEQKNLDNKITKLIQFLTLNGVSYFPKIPFEIIYKRHNEQSNNITDFRVSANYIYREGDRVISIQSKSMTEVSIAVSTPKRTKEFILSHYASIEPIKDCSSDIEDRQKNIKLSNIAKMGQILSIFSEDS